MHYYEVFVAISSYQKPEPLTYASAEAVPIGTIVEVPFGQRNSVGFIASQVEHKPDFPTKPIKEILGNRPLPPATRKLFNWLQIYYPSGSGAITQLFIPSNLRQKSRILKSTTPASSAADYALAVDKNTKAASLPPLTFEQQAVITAIDAHATPEKKHHFLLHGDTGSGKTRIYIEQTQKCVNNGKSAIILTPEIALTPQIARNFIAQFGNAVIVIHSALTPKARRESWLRILHSTEPLVIVGARSALFAPLAHVGLIVVDEMHEPAYKQEQAPRYQA
ncbi:MAG: hypothetical protein NVS3B3_24590 [Aquirhabdus sp.]